MSLGADLAAVMAAQIRVTVLQLLAGQHGGSANDAVLYEAVNAMDLRCSRDEMREHLFWMAGQNMLSVLDMRLRSGLVVATLTERGADVAAGRSFIAGVARKGS